MIISTANLLTGRLPFATNGAGEASGYSFSYLTDGQIANLYRNSIPQGSLTLDYRLAAATPVQFFGAFNFKGSGASGLWLKVFTRDTTIGSYVEQGQGVAYSRDGARHAHLALPAPVNAIDIRLQIYFSAFTISAIECAELWAGALVDLGRDETTARVGLVNSNVHTVGPSGVVAAYRHGPNRRRISLGFEKFTAAEHAKMEQVFAETYGLAAPAVLVYDGQAYHGRLNNDPGWIEDAPIYDGYSWEFLESGRGI